MRTIFDGLVEEFRAWHLFEQQAGDSPQRDLPGLFGPDLPGYGPGGYEPGGYGGPGYAPPGSGMPPYGGAGFGSPGPEAPGYGGAGYDREPRHGRDLRGAAPRPGAPR